MDKKIYIPTDEESKITNYLSKDLNYWLESLYLFKPTKQDLIYIPNVLKPTNQKTYVFIKLWVSV